MRNEVCSPEYLRDWFAVQVWAGREHLCAKHLAVRGYDVFLPSYSDQRRWSDRVKVVNRALFTGYVFCCISHEVLGKIVTTPGVIRIVGDGSGAVPVETREIECLQRVVEAGLGALPWEFLQEGQRVHIMEGPLRGAEGIIVRVKNRHRLIVSVSLLRRSVAVEIDPGWVRVSPEVLLDNAGYGMAIVDAAADLKPAS